MTLENNTRIKTKTNQTHKSQKLKEKHSNEVTTLPKSRNLTVPLQNAPSRVT